MSPAPSLMCRAGGNTCRVDLRPILAKGEMFNFPTGQFPLALTVSSSKTTVVSQAEHKRARSCYMAEEIDLRFLGEQIKRLQGDVRQVKSDMAQMRTDVGGEL